MDNTGNVPLRVPGINGVPVMHEIDPAQDFTNGSYGWTQDPRLTAREVAMIGLMESLTDEKDWHLKVFHQDAVERWRQESMSRPLISQKTWDWCVSELRDKAANFSQTRRVAVLDTGSCVCKSDSLVEESVVTGLKDGITKLQEQLFGEVATPSATQQQFKLVDPSMFPLIYGRTTVLKEGGKVGIGDPLESYSQGQPTTPHPEERVDPARVDYAMSHFNRPYNNEKEAEFYQWSLRYQWLPCEVEFSGSGGNSVRITSYINNLPTRYESTYRAVEKLIEFSIEPWNACLIKGGQSKPRWDDVLNAKRQSGRFPMRIRTYGALWESTDFPEWGRGSRLNALEENRSSEAYRAARKQVREYLELEDDSNDGTEEEKFWYGEEDGIEDWDVFDVEDILKAKWQDKHEVAHPEPGTAFSYEEWKMGKNGRAIVGRTNHAREDLRNQIPLDADHEIYEVQLQESYRAQGLQVIVKIENIELNPASPSFAGSDWTFQALRNEHIVATSVYYYDVQNITESRLSFRQQTCFERTEYVYWEDTSRNLDDLKGLARTFGYEYDEEGSHVPNTQDLGSVSTHQGRFLSWPNVLQHRVEPFKLLDPSKAGHRRCIVLYLVDPNYRIASTRNVPPQQHDWWAQAALTLVNRAPGGETKLPEELVAQIDAETEEWPLGAKEAEAIKLEVERERDLAFNAVAYCMPAYMIDI